MKLLRQLFILTVISDLIMILLLGIMSSFEQGILRNLKDLPAAIMLIGPIYFVPYLFISIFYYFIMRYLINKKTVFQLLGKRIAYTFLLFLICALGATLIYSMFIKFVKGEQFILFDVNFRGFLISFSYCPIMILVNEFLYPKWFRTTYTDIL